MQLANLRVLVTGADGFIGSHLVEHLAAEGARVRALACYNSFNSWGWLDESPIRNEVEVVSGDIRDANFCHGLLRDIEVVFHLAALIPIPYSYMAPDSFVDTNIRGTLHLCQAARSAGVRRFVHTSTSEVYGSARYVPIDEAHPLTPQSPYSATKIGADAIAQSFFYAFGLPVVVARPFNTYGPRQSARAVIPTIITQLASGRRDVELGDVRTTRDFTFVEDTCRGMVAVASVEQGAGEVFNIGSNSEISIGDVLTMIAAEFGVEARSVESAARLRPAASEVQRLRCDGSKLEQASGFRPHVSFKDGLARTVAWFRAPGRLERYKSHLYNV
jgi:NAD dependent epimerase/dehydratase